MLTGSFVSTTTSLLSCWGGGRWGGWSRSAPPQQKSWVFVAGFGWEIVAYQSPLLLCRPGVWGTRDGFGLGLTRSPGTGWVPLPAPWGISVCGYIQFVGSFLLQGPGLGSVPARSHCRDPFSSFTISFSFNDHFLLFAKSIKGIQHITSFATTLFSGASPDFP